MDDGKESLDVMVMVLAMECASISHVMDVREEH